MFILEYINYLPCVYCIGLIFSLVWNRNDVQTDMASHSQTEKRIACDSKNGRAAAHNLQSTKPAVPTRKLVERLAKLQLTYPQTHNSQTSRLKF